MILAIVGADGKEFTPASEARARKIIRELFKAEKPRIVISGACPYGGIDVWAIQEARKMGLQYYEFAPVFKGWAAYKKRNIEIAKNAHKVVCITLNARKWRPLQRRLPPPRCSHCQQQHLQNGGCWTVNYAKSLGKMTEVIVIQVLDSDDQS